MPRGAVPTVQVCWMAPVAASMATTVFWPLTAAYTVEPSGENTAWPTRDALPPWVGTGTLTGLVSEPSGFTVNLVKPVLWPTHSWVPSGEYVGPSWPTLLP